MRDIDFDELDRAVNNYLENGNVQEVKTIQSEYSTQEDNTNRGMVFTPRRAPQTASQLHAQAIAKPSINIESRKELDKQNTEEKNEKHIPKIVDDFKDSNKIEQRTRGNRNITDSKTEEIAFESPVLETLTFDKPVRNYRRLENSPIRQSFSSSTRRKAPALVTSSRLEGRSINPIHTSMINDIHPVIKDEAKKSEQSNAEVSNNITEENKIPEDSKRSFTPRAQEFAGVYNIVDDDEGLTVFGENAEVEEVKIVDKSAPIPSFNLSERDTFDKVMPEIGSEESPISAKKDENVPDQEIGDKIIIHTNNLPGKDYEKQNVNNQEEFKPKIKIMETPEDRKGYNKTGGQDSSEEKVVIRPAIEEEPVIKTPFVQNPQIEKRPLGSGSTTNNASVRDLEFRKTPKIRNQKSTIVRDLKEAKASAPMLASDEYSAPVMHKKKSGWGVVFGILIVLILGVLSGLAAYLLIFR